MYQASAFWDCLTRGPRLPAEVFALLTPKPSKTLQALIYPPQAASTKAFFGCKRPGFDEKVYAYMQNYAHICMRNDTYANICHICTCMFCAYTRMHTYARVWTHMHAYTCTHMHTHANECAHTYTYTSVCTRIHSNTHMNARAQVCLRSHAYAHACTHMLTYAHVC